MKRNRIENLRELADSFVQRVRQKLSGPIEGEPEDQLRAPLESLLEGYGKLTGKSIVCKGETRLAGRLGKPDYSILVDGALAGIIEIKAPGKGADPDRYKGHDKRQWERFKDGPNVLYTDGNDWALFHSGKRHSHCRLIADIASAKAKGPDADAARALDELFGVFLGWNPEIPAEFKDWAKALAPLCRLLRHAVEEAVRAENSNLNGLAKDWRHLLFPTATDAQFADAYAQTVTFALLLARLDGADVEKLSEAEQKLQSQHSLLARALQILTEASARDEIEPALSILQRFLNQLRPKGGADWLYFYEYFLEEYDADLRKNAGVYYTPVEVVRCQVRLVDEILRERLGKARGYCDKDVVTLDPAVGTGTYLLGVIDHALERIKREEGEGAVPARAKALAANLYGFERMVGPYAVAELRVSRAVAEHGSKLPKSGLTILLTDTLESPFTQPEELPQFLKPISEHHERALKIKESVPVIVCLGNPPYDRHAASATTDESKTGGWVRYGEFGKPGKGNIPILEDFIAPARRAGRGRHIHNLYNLYVYFWRWALWKVFEHPKEGAGVVSFITASSYLVGPGFAGMREHLRRVCDELWIINLGGEGRGSRREENVFDIQTPVCIGIGLRREKRDANRPADVYYIRFRGTRAEKLRKLNRIVHFKDLKWRKCPNGWQDKFWPMGQEEYFGWPLVTDLFPWQQSGVKAGRTWVIAPDQDTLKRRCRILVRAQKTSRSEYFKESPTGRKIHDSPMEFQSKGPRLKSISTLDDSLGIKLARYSYRSFDRAWIIGDPRFIDRPSPSLWLAQSTRQCYFTTISTTPLGGGPAATACAYIPDLHHFMGSFGAKDVFPLYRDANAKVANISTGHLDALSTHFGKLLQAESLFAYCYGILANPGFSDRFRGELESCELRIPITKDISSFRKIESIGRRLLWLHTYGERFSPASKSATQISAGRARCAVAVSDAPDQYPETFSYDEVGGCLHVGDGVFGPVPQEMVNFEVSGVKVVQSWLGYRMKDRKGKKSSPLDDVHPERWTADFTTELLQLLWVLEATLDEYPKMAKLLDEVLAGPLFTAGEFPPVPEALRRPPREPGDEYVGDIEELG